MSDIIFDFDGTIADSFVLNVSIFEDLLNRQPRLSADDIERLRGMGPWQILEDLRIRPWALPWLVARGRRRLKHRINEVHTCDGMEKLVKQLKTDGHRLYITSSNSKQNIELFLKRHGLLDEFISIYGNVGLLGKARALRKVICRNNLTAAETFYIGDEVRDIEAAERAGLRMIAVGWGYNTPSILLEHEPEFLVHKPKQIAEIIAEATN